MAYHGELADRIRAALAATPSVREVKMFGGLSFMVNDKMVVSVHSDGDLLVRADPERADELLTTVGARPAEMGAGRAMGNGWISVAQAAVATGESFDFWIGVALAYNDRSTGTRSVRRRKKGAYERFPRLTPI
ncbi:MAG: TfoX/Sxy family protein [Mycobacteriales bacterium]